MKEVRYQYKLTEEIARWAFEVHVRELPDWNIAFTNPTAGPWKRLMANDSKGMPGEVHRFLREDDRPDLVLVNDTLRSILIIEAKDTLGRLLTAAQVGKSCAVVVKLSTTLRDLRDNPFWGDRAGYRVLPGLLWGSSTPSVESQRLSAFETYEEEFAAIGLHHRGLIGIEILRDGDALLASGYSHAAATGDLSAQILTSLSL